MAHVTSIHIYECDDCMTVAVLKNREEQQEFNDTWTIKHGLTFCPKCCDKMQNLVRIRDARSCDRAVSYGVRKYLEAPHAR